MTNYIVRKAHWQAFFSQMSEIELLVVSLLLKLNSKYDQIFPSQANIAMWTGCSRKTVNKILKRLDELKIVEKIYRHRKSCIYNLSSKFNEFVDFPDARKSLPGLINYGFKLIMKFFNAPKVTPYKEENSFNYSSSVSESKTVSLVRDLTNRFINKSSKKEEERMEKISSLKVPPVLKEINDRIGLTLWGQIRLIIYAEEALQATLDRYKQGVSDKDVFLWFETYCHGISIKNNYPINLELYDTMKKRYEMPSNPKWIKSQKIYQNQETFYDKNVSILPSERTNSIVGKYKEVHHDFAQYTRPGDNT